MTTIICEGCPHTHVWGRCCRCGGIEHATVRTIRKSTDALRARLRDAHDEARRAVRA